MSMVSLDNSNSCAIYNQSDVLDVSLMTEAHYFYCQYSYEPAQLCVETVCTVFMCVL